jgi:hypothetical protein
MEAASAASINYAAADATQAFGTKGRRAGASVFCSRIIFEPQFMDSEELQGHVCNSSDEEDESQSMDKNNSSTLLLS